MTLTLLRFYESFLPLLSHLFLYFQVMQIQTSTLKRIGQMGLWGRSGVPSPMTTPHCHNDIEINFMEKGRIAYLFRDRRITIQEGQWAIFWGAVPHRLTEVAQPRMHWVTVPLARFLQWTLPSAFTESILHGTLHTPPALPWDPALIADWCRTLSHRELAGEHDEAIALMEIEARLFRMAQSWVPPRLTQPSRPSTNPSKVETMACYISLHYQDPLRLETITGSTGLHRNYACALFKSVFGVSLMDYVIQHRVWHAQRMLSTTNNKIIDVAMEAGFGSLSRFYAQFSRLCDMTPRAYRQQCQAPGVATEYHKRKD